MGPILGGSRLCVCEMSVCFECRLMRSRGRLGFRVSRTIEDRKPDARIREGFVLWVEEVVQGPPESSCRSDSFLTAEWEVKRFSFVDC